MLCSSELTVGRVNHMISKLEQQQGPVRPPSRQRLHTKLSRSVSQPATRPKVSTSLPPLYETTDGSRHYAGEPAYRQPRPPETEIGRKSGAGRAMRQTSANERSAHARTDVNDDARITSSLRQPSAIFNEVRYDLV